MTTRKHFTGAYKAQVIQQVLREDKTLAQITALTAHPELAAAARLRKVPGIGPVTAAALASRLGGMQFSHPDKLVAYIGLDIGVQQSGRKKGERGLTKQGDADPSESRHNCGVCCFCVLRRACSAKTPASRINTSAKKPKGYRARRRCVP